MGRKIIKRVYQKGRELTLPSAEGRKKKASDAKKQVMAASSPTVRHLVDFAREGGHKERQGDSLVCSVTAKSKHAYRGVALPFRNHLEQSGGADYSVSQEPFNDHGRKGNKYDFIDEAVLPCLGALTRLTLMARDPFGIYAYWEVSESSVEELRQKAGEKYDCAKRVLRMYDVTYKIFDGTNANHFFDLEIGTANNWYINLWNDNVSYIGELGVRLDDGRFLALARSNWVHTPRFTFSPRSEQIWMEVKENKKKARPYVVLRFETEGNGFGNPAMEYYSESGTVTSQAEEGERVPQSANGRGRSAKRGAKYSLQKINTGRDISRQRFISRRKYYITEDDVRRYYASLTPLLRLLLLPRLARRILSLSLEGESFAERETIYSRLPRHLLRRFLCGASEEMQLSEESRLPESFASEQPQAGASEFSSRQPGNKRSFFFEIGTELIVYGRTEPDAEVWMGNQKVSLRPDGTFSMRFSLPSDHKIPFDFIAISRDKEQNSRIWTSCQRDATVRNEKIG